MFNYVKKKINDVFYFYFYFFILNLFIYQRKKIRLIMLQKNFLRNLPCFSFLNHQPFFQRSKLYRALKINYFSVKLLLSAHEALISGRRAGVGASSYQKICGRKPLEKRWYVQMQTNFELLCPYWDCGKCTNQE